MHHMQILSTPLGSKGSTKEQAFVVEGEVLVPGMAPALEPSALAGCDTRLISCTLNPSAHALAISFLVFRSLSCSESVD